MAANAFPKVTAKAWASLRTKAAAAPSTKFTPASVAALMGMASPDSARVNTVSPMRRLGLIDDEGALTPRGNKWRIDDSFGEACQEILDEIYPAELGVLVDDDGYPDLAKVKTWFDHKGYGESNARQMAATYVMVASKQVPEPPLADGGKKMAAPKKKDANKPSKVEKSEKTQQAVPHEPSTPPENSNGSPSVHLDIQIHIPADATPEQIDQIFSSMARHLYAK